MPDDEWPSLREGTRPYFLAVSDTNCLLPTQVREPGMLQKDLEEVAVPAHVVSGKTVQFSWLSLVVYCLLSPFSKNI